MRDPFHARDVFNTGAGTAGIYRLSKLEDAGLTKISALPYSIRVLLESVLRTCDGRQVTEDDVRGLAAWQAERTAAIEVPFKPARVVLQDFTGVPAVVDLAAMRSAMQRLGGDPEADQPADPRRSGDRPLGAGRPLRLDRRPWPRTSPWSSSGTASATSFSAGGRRRSTISASCRRRWASSTR